jgi:isopentenyldiphosphate isomerase
MAIAHGQENSEILSVVDERDRVIGPRRRDDIHRLGLRHRASHVLVFDIEGRLFLQKRGLHKDSNPGLWDSSVAGHVDDGESYDQCCIREIKEEIGIQVESVPERLFKVDACAATGMEFSWIYRLITDKKIELDYSEIEAGGWYDVGTVDQWLRERRREFADSFQLIWNSYRKQDFPWPTISSI